MMSLQSTGTSTASATATRSSIDPPQWRGSVKTEIAVAPAPAYASACAIGSTSDRNAPSAGETRFTSAMTASRPARGRGAQLEWLEPALAHDVATHLPRTRRAARADLVEAVLAMNDEGVLDAELGEDAGDLLPERRRRDAEQHAPHPGGIRERSEDVEDRADPDLSAHRPGVTHRGVVSRREHEPDPRLIDAAHDRLGTKVDADAERLQHVSAPARARRGTVAVLRDPAAACGDHDGCDRRDVEAVRAITARADDVDRIAAERHAHRDVAQRRGTTSDLVDRLSSAVQGRQQRAELRGRRLAGHDRGHRAAGLVAREGPARRDDAERFTGVQGSSPACAARRRS